MAKLLSFYLFFVFFGKKNFFFGDVVPSSAIKAIDVLIKSIFGGKKIEKKVFQKTTTEIRTIDIYKI
jgi:hypothetical protein